MTKLYLRMRRFWRKWRYRSVPPFMLQDETMRPVGVRGMHLVIRSQESKRDYCFSIDETSSKKSFLQAWYALGGGDTCLEDGTPIDPDDL